MIGYVLMFAVGLASVVEFLTGHIGAAIFWFATAAFLVLVANCGGPI